MILHGRLSQLDLCGSADDRLLLVSDKKMSSQAGTADFEGREHLQRGRKVTEAMTEQQRVHALLCQSRGSV